MAKFEKYHTINFTYITRDNVDIIIDIKCKRMTRTQRTHFTFGRRYILSRQSIKTVMSKPLNKIYFHYIYKMIDNGLQF